MRRTGDLSPEVLDGIRRLNAGAHGHPFVEDRAHALGGLHFLILEDGEPASHASVVERALETGGGPLRTGYLEAVATRPDRQRRGLATAIMRAVADHIRETFDLGALSGDDTFYTRLGWVFTCLQERLFAPRDALNV